MLNNQIRSIAAAAVGAALGLTGASSVQAQTLELLYEFGSTRRPEWPSTMPAT